MTNEWIYSNPTGNFNLSVPDKAMKTSEYGLQTTTYAKFKKEQSATGQMPELLVKKFAENKQIGPVILKVVFDD